MSSPLRIEVTDEARAQIVAAAGWWAENRPSAPGAVLEDLDRILELGVRRIMLSRIHYYVYYRVAGDTLQVLAFWHTSRGRGPRV